MNKLFLLIKSLYIYIKYKIIYKNRICLSKVNSLRGHFEVFLKKGSKLNIGDFLMCLGPLYLRCGENANIKIGKKCFFNRNCSLTAAESITIGNNCMIANNVVIIDHDHKINGKSVSSELVSSPVQIEDNVWIGANSTILKGVHIGKGAVIAAGAVVTKDVEEYSVYAGVPAKKISQRGAENE